MTDTNGRWHLERTVTDRGFGHLPPIPSEYGGNIRVYESSAADGPHVWVTATAPASLNDPTGPTVEAPLHLTADNARRLGEQLIITATWHYQNPVRDQIRELVVAGIRNQEMHRRAAVPILEAAGFASAEAYAIARTAEEEA